MKDNTVKERKSTEAFAKELIARRKMLSDTDETNYKKIKFMMENPLGNSTREIEEYIEIKRRELIIAEKKWIKSYNKRMSLIVKECGVFTERLKRD